MISVIPEALMACTAIVSTAKASRRNVAEYLLSTSSSACYSLSTGTSLMEKVGMEFEELAGVGRVQVHQNGTRILVDVEMSTFDRATRRQAYSKEWQMYNEYPGYTFDVRLIDQTPRQTIDAIQG